MPFDGIPTPKTEIGQLASQVADYLETHGHWQEGSAYGPDGSACVIGALMKILGEEEENLKHVFHLKKALGVYLIASWSDTTPTQEVLLRLRALP